jgi:hypothetical protein
VTYGQKALDPAALLEGCRLGAGARSCELACACDRYSLLAAAVCTGPAMAESRVWLATCSPCIALSLCVVQI